MLSVLLLSDLTSYTCCGGLTVHRKEMESMFFLSNLTISIKIFFNYFTFLSFIRSVMVEVSVFICKYFVSRIGFLK